MSGTLICYDNSPSARHALQVARRSLGEGPVVLLNVWSEPERVHADSFGFQRHGDGVAWDRMLALFEDQSREALDQGVQLARSIGMSVETRSERSPSSVWQTILAVADELDSDLILVGTRGPNPVADDLLGSISYSLAHHCRRPLLIVPEPQA